MPAVDIIIPTRDRPDLTARAVQSVINQTFTDWRLFVVDDGSSPENLASLEQLVCVDDRVQVVSHSLAGGGPAARQTGLNAGSADWVAILDSDDKWLPEKLESQLGMTDGADIVLCWFSWVGRDGNVRVTRRLDGAGFVSPTLTNNNDIPLIRRSTLLAAGGFIGDASTPRRFDDNTDFFIRLLAAGRVAVVPQVLVLCSDHDGVRESDGVSKEAESLRDVVLARGEQLAPWPDTRSELYARISARYFARHQFGPAFKWLARAVSVGSLRQRLRSARRVGPYGAKMMWFAASKRIRRNSNA